MSYGLRVTANPAGRPLTPSEANRPDPAGLYIAGFDPLPDGQAFYRLTDQPGEARAFDHPGGALEWWRSPHPTVPTRDTDGRPNRPLTAFTIEVVNLDGRAVTAGRLEVGQWARPDDSDGIAPWLRIDAIETVTDPYAIKVTMAGNTLYLAPSDRWVVRR